MLIGKDTLGFVMIPQSSVQLDHCVMCCVSNYGSPQIKTKKQEYNHSNLLVFWIKVCKSISRRLICFGRDSGLCARSARPPRRSHLASSRQESESKSPAANEVRFNPHNCLIKVRENINVIFVIKALLLLVTLIVIRNLFTSDHVCKML